MESLCLVFHVFWSRWWRTIPFLRVIALLQNLSAAKVRSGANELSYISSPPRRPANRKRLPPACFLASSKVSHSNSVFIFFIIASLFLTTDQIVFSLRSSYNSQSNTKWVSSSTSLFFSSSDGHNKQVLSSSGRGLSRLVILCLPVSILSSFVPPLSLVITLLASLSG